MASMVSAPAATMQGGVGGRAGVEARPSDARGEGAAHGDIYPLPAILREPVVRAVSSPRARARWDRGTTRSCAAIDLIKPGYNGWLVPAGNEDSLYEAMRAALKLREREWQDLSRQARESVARHTPVNGANRLLAGVDSALREAASP